MDRYISFSLYVTIIGNARQFRDLFYPTNEHFRRINTGFMIIMLSLRDEHLDRASAYMEYNFNIDALPRDELRRLLNIGLNYVTSPNYDFLTNLDYHVTQPINDDDDYEDPTSPSFQPTDEDNQRQNNLAEDNAARQPVNDNDYIILD